MPETRTFIAIGLTDDIRAALEQTTRQLRSAPGGDACRWSAVETVHLTLKFLGDVSDVRLPEVYAAVERSTRDCSAFRVEIAGLGCFPNLQRPRVIWAGVRDEAGVLARLAERLDRELAGLGFAREERPFRPHLTIGRVKRNASRGALAELGQTIANWPALTFGQSYVEKVSVYASVLRPEGPLHTVLHEAPLGAIAGDSYTAN